MRRYVVFSPFTHTAFAFEARLAAVIAADAFGTEVFDERGDVVHVGGRPEERGKGEGT